MGISTYVRFKANGKVPEPSAVSPTPGAELVAHLVGAFRYLGLGIRGVKDMEYGHEIRCDVRGMEYCVTVGYDWLAKGWWEVSYSRRLPWLRRLLGQSEEQEMRVVTAALAHAVATLPGTDARWYPDYTPESSEYTVTPEY